MLQDIAPHSLNIGYQNYKAEETDYLIVCNNNQVLVHKNEGFPFPTIADAHQYYNTNTERLIYLFDIDGKRFFLSQDDFPETDDYNYQDVRSLRDSQPKWFCFVGATAMHLTRWYKNNRFCGKCAHQMLPKEDERALSCPECDRIIYPRINPVVIIGITNGKQLLLAKNTNAEYKGYGLIAGFMEVGETLEDTVKREVWEEVGLTVKDIRYYKSQPWAFSESVLIGFFAEVDGNTEPVLDGKELTEAIWCPRKDLPADNSRFSLTWDMIESFRLEEV